MIKNTREQYSLEYYSQTRWTIVSQLAKKYLSNPTRNRSRITEGEAGPISVPVSPKRNGSANRKSKFTEEIRSGKGTARDPRGIAHVSSSIDLSIGLVESPVGRTHRATNSGEADLKVASEILSRDPRQTSGRLRRRILKLGGDIYITAVSPTGYVGGGIKVRLIARGGKKI